MSQMEDDAKRFLQRIIWTLFSTLFWLIFTLGIGMYNHLIVPEKGISTANILFYIWMLLSLAALIWFNVRIWKEKFPHG